MTFSIFYATVELKKQISSSLRLVNSTDNYVAFKVIDSAWNLDLYSLPRLNAAILIITLVKISAPLFPIA